MILETLHPVELIGKHLDRNNLRLTNHAINSKCAISGKDITQGGKIAIVNIFILLQILD